MTGEYIRDASYASAYNPMQAPIQLAVSAAFAGVRGPDPARAFHMLEIGCGTGVTLCVLADAYPHASFTGVDFNQLHIEKAVARAARAELTNIKFIRADVDSLQGASVGPADFVTVAGLYSWLDRNRQKAMVRLAREALAPAGLFHVHYASQPGAGQAEALHDALALIAPTSGSSEQRLSAALQNMTALKNAEAAFFQSNPKAAQRLMGAANNLLSDEAHEILSRGAGACWFGRLAQEFEKQGLSPVAEVSALRNLASDGAMALAAIIRVETLNDLRIDRGVRQDVFARAPLAIEPAIGVLNSYRWHVQPKARAGSGKPLAALWGLPETEARQMAALLHAGGVAADVSSAIGTPFEKALASALRRGLIKPLLNISSPVSAQARLSTLNRVNLEASLVSSASTPLSARAAGTQLSLPVLDRLRLFALTGGDVDEVFARIDASASLSSARRQEFQDGLSQSALASFSAAAVPELRALGVLI